MEINLSQLQAWLALYSAAQMIGETVLDGVKHIAKQKLSREELVALEAAWDGDVQRSARNAGIAPEPNIPLPPPIVDDEA